MAPIAYTGQSRSTEWCGRLVEVELGECTVRGELPPRRGPWFYDNGAFGDFVEVRPFDASRFERDMRAIRLWSDPAGPGIPWNKHGAGNVMPLPQFIVLPDLVARGAESLRFSVDYAIGALAPLGGYPPGVPLYLAVQDGMEEPAVLEAVARIGAGGLFVGGSLAWKLQTGEAWVRFAHALGLRCHIGRAMSADRIAWATRIGADSIDGNAPNWSDEGLACSVRARQPQAQLGLGL